MVLKATNIHYFKCMKLSNIKKFKKILLDKVHSLYAKNLTGIVSEIIAEIFSNLGKHQSSRTI